MDFGRFGYSFFMVLATLVAGFLYRRQKRTIAMTKTQRWGIGIGGLVGATFAAKIPFILEAGGSASVFDAWLSDGKTVLWGLAGGYVGVEVAKWSLYVRGKTGDSFVIPVAVAIAIGRMGCLVQGCCYGIPTNQSWGLRSIPADSGALLRHPAAFYEIVFHLSFAGLAYYGGHKGWLKNQWMLLYLISYAAFRFVSETWREEPKWFSGLTFYQSSSIVIGLAFTIVLIKPIITMPREKVASYERREGQ